MKRQRWLSFIFSVFIFLSSASAQKPTNTFDYEPIRIGFFPIGNFQYYNENQEPAGYNVDLLNKLSENARLHYVYVKTNNWQETLELLEEGKIDIIAPASYTADRDKNFLYSDNYIGSEYSAILMNINSKYTRNVAYEDYKAFSNLKFGIVDSYVHKSVFFEYAKDNNFTTDITYFKDTEELMDALDKGIIDCVVTNLLSATRDHKIVARFSPDNFYYLFNKNKTELKDLFDHLIRNLLITEPFYLQTLTQQYFWQFFYQSFTRAEADFILNSPPITIGYIKNRDPLSYTNKEGFFTGITKDILDEISLRTGLSFNYREIPEGEMSMKILYDTDIDVLSSVEHNEINTKISALYMTQPYFSSQKVFVGLKNSIFHPEQNYTIGVQEGSKTLDYAIKMAYPNFKIKKYPTTESALRAILSKDIDFTLQNQFVIERLISKSIYENLQIVPNAGIPDKLSLAIMTDPNTLEPSENDKLFVSIINKTIQQITNDVLSHIIVNNTVARPYQPTVMDFVYHYKKALIIIVLLLFILINLTVEIIRQRKAKNDSILLSEFRLRTITNSINGGVISISLDKEPQLVFANEGLYKLLQLTKEEFNTIPISEYQNFVHPDDLMPILELLTVFKATKQLISMKFKLRRKDNTYVDILVNATFSITTENVPCVYAVFMDISYQEKIVNQLHLEQSRYKLFLENSHDMFFDINLQTGEVYKTSLLENQLGSIMPRHYDGADFFAQWNVAKEDEDFFLSITNEVLNGAEKKFIKIRLLRNKTTQFWAMMSLRPIIENKVLTRIIGRIEDIDNEEKEREVIIRKAQIDTLTGLYRKETFMELAQSYLNLQHQKETALIFLDLDNFKLANDTLGHLQGDYILTQTAEKLQVIFSNYDIISRFGGDEFCILVKDIPNETLEEKLRWTIEKLHEEYNLGAKKVTISTSIGVAISSIAGAKISELIHNADKALYKSKELGKNQYTIYSDDMVLNGYKNSRL